MYFLLSLGSVSWAFEQVRYRKINKCISRYFKKKLPNNVFIVKFEKFTEGLQINRSHFYQKTL